MVSASEVVDRFDVTVRAEFGVIPEPARHESQVLLPRTDHRGCSG